MRNTMSNEELFARFYNAVKTAHPNHLQKAHANDIYNDEFEDPNGKLYIFHAPLEGGTYLTYLIFYVENTELSIYSLDRKCVLAKYKHDPKTGSWTDVKPIVVNGTQVASMSDVFEYIIKKFRDILTT